SAISPKRSANERDRNKTPFGKWETGGFGRPFFCASGNCYGRAPVLRFSDLWRRFHFDVRAALAEHRKLDAGRQFSKRKRRFLRLKEAAPVFVSMYRCLSYWNSFIELTSVCSTPRTSGMPTKPHASTSWRDVVPSWFPFAMFFFSL